MLWRDFFRDRRAQRLRDMARIFARRETVDRERAAAGALAGDIADEPRHLHLPRHDLHDLLEERSPVEAIFHLLHEQVAGF